ncbi:MAG: hypothetical protein IJS22_08810 [Lachnospiraceae bacterium]|nr:hypothetical protein [Lachnospiraceae bacterium]
MQAWNAFFDFRPVFHPELQAWNAFFIFRPVFSSGITGLERIFYFQACFFIRNCRPGTRFSISGLFFHPELQAWNEFLDFRPVFSSGITGLERVFPFQACKKKKPGPGLRVSA